MRSKRISLLAGVAMLAMSVLAPSVMASPRGGALHMTKECSEYTGGAGSFCTFTSSSIKAIEPGARIVYAEAAGATTLDTDVAIVAGPGNVVAGHCALDFIALPGRCTFSGGTGNVVAGHCALDFMALPGRCTFSGGTGKFTHFHASVAVSVDLTGLWHWEGTYSFSPRD